MSYQCNSCFALGDERSFSQPDTGLCDGCQQGSDEVGSRIRELIEPYLTRWGQSEVGDLARAIRDVLDERKAAD
ncbi:hypothetical protein MMUC44124_01065 [Mycolicibacterium mucogenicum DSM 44124]|uniref:Uncharacterized protein n=1 Tax=Mycolicibacterium mucogenicum DSM 44124 TaxID=1226753 RepID=A0A8H2PFN4_MYCMU|nr:hypothetical protein MMUC44124_01065 [Mycolicibacterium mucogenicum DSM 44124]